MVHARAVKVCLTAQESLSNLGVRFKETDFTSVTRRRNIMTKQSGDKASSIAAKVLPSGQATKGQVKTLAASVLSQDQTKGKRGK